MARERGEWWQLLVFRVLIVVIILYPKDILTCANDLSSFIDSIHIMVAIFSAF